jgi:murein tripeptide amidase MpaA
MRTSILLLTLAGSTIAGEAPAAAQDDAPAEVTRFDGHNAVRVTPRTTRELLTVLALTEDVLTCEGAGVGPFDVRFTPDQFQAFLRTGIPHEILIPDLQQHIDAWKRDNQRIREQAGPDGPGFYDVFRNFAEIHARLDSLVAAHPTLATSSVIGQSVEGRPIRMIRVTGPGATQSRPAMVFNGTQHSRESLSPMTAMYFLEQLLSGYGPDPRITALVDGIDFHFIPVVNPDGYNYVWTTNPLWRKNRRNNGGNCFGIDLNRNWGYGWGNNNGSSPDPCNDIYRGPSPFSEPETQAIASVIGALAAEDRLVAHMDIHSYATKLLSPWGYTLQPPPEIHRMDYLGALMRNHIAQTRGTAYWYGQGSVILYIVSGGSRDYTYGQHGALGWTIELPGTSFHPPASEILPVAQESTLGFLALAEHFLPAAQTGACCVVGGCIVVRESECTAAGGVFQGANSTCAASNCPSMLPTTFPNAGLTQVGSGVFFNLTASTELDLTRIDYSPNASLGTSLSAQLWTYPGSYLGHDTNQSGWVLHETFTGLTSGGIGMPAPLFLANPLSITPGQTVGCYLVAQSGGVRYTNTDTTAWTNGDLTLFSDRARSAPWGGTLYSPRTFAGGIYYTLPGQACYANCDASTAAPVLNVADFTCFLLRFAAADPYANCDNSTAAPVLNVADFTCYLQRFAAGCP